MKHCFIILSIIFLGLFLGGCTESHMRITDEDGRVILPSEINDSYNLGIPQCDSDVFASESPRSGTGVVYLGNFYCEGLGYKLMAKVDERGQERSVCVFPDGSSCDLVSFFSGQCGKQFTFCERRGYNIVSRTEQVGSMTLEYAVCLFDDGTECGETDYISCKCDRGEQRIKK